MREEFLKISDGLILQTQNIDRIKYLDQINKIYGAINVLDDNMLQEIVIIEKERTLQNKNLMEKELREKDLFNEYSKIAFCMARKSFIEDRCFYIADTMKRAFIAFVDYYEEELVDEDCKKIVSETILDFDFASGNKKVSSIRMIPILSAR